MQNLLFNTLEESMKHEDEVSLSQAAIHADYSQAKEGTLENSSFGLGTERMILRPSNAELRLMASGHKKGETSQAAVVRSVRKVLCGRTGVLVSSM
ncbi:hypothetical protein Tco_0324393 [Tanacetum coccineum]